MRNLVVWMGLLAAGILSGCEPGAPAGQTGTGKTAAGGHNPGWKDRIFGAPAGGEVIAGPAAAAEMKQADDRPTIIRKIDDAVALAEAAVAKKYGTEAAALQRPYSAVIVDNAHWLVLGSPAQGKTAQVRLRVAGGAIISVDLVPAESVQKLPRGSNSGQFSGMYE